MDEIVTIIRTALPVLAICAAGALIGAIALLVIASRQIAQIEIPEDADFFETLQHLPITVPLALDLLDMVFDIFSAPIAWVILELLGLQALQLITIIEGVIPGTQLIPTMTIAWIIARMMKKRQKQSMARAALYEYQLQQRASRYGALRSGRSLAYQYRRRPLPLPDESYIDGEVTEEERFEDEFEDAPPEYRDDERW